MLGKTARKTNNFLRRATNASGREKTICIDPFTKTPPLIVSDIVAFLNEKGEKQTNKTNNETINNVKNRI